MRSVLLLMAVFAVNVLSAQFVIINSPQDIEGPIAFTGAYSVDSLWNVDLSDSIWTHDAFVVEDLGRSTEACEPLTQASASEVAGNFALIDRGTCTFTEKVCNAQNAGAAGVIIMNHTPGDGPGPMGYTDGICVVTIPVVHISYEDGQRIKDAIDNGDVVNITMGAVQYDNNLATGPTDVMFAPLGVIPMSQVQSDDDFIVTPGARVTNLGVNDQNNVTVAATITKDGSTVYDESGTIASILSDSAETVFLTDYKPFNDGIGVYELNYEVSGENPDDVPLDNSISNTFVLSDATFSKAGWDLENNRPKRTNAYTISGGGPIEFLAPFSIPYPTGLQVDSAIFYVSTNLASLADVGITAFLYKWDDVNADGVMATDEISIKGLSQIIFPSDETATDAWVRTPLLNLTSNLEEGYPLEADDNNMVLGIRYEGPDLVYIGFDENQDYTLYIDYRADQLTDGELPYIVIDSWTVDNTPDVDGGGLFQDLFASVASALVLGETEVSTNNVLSNDQLQMTMFPNPVSEQLTIDIELAQTSATANYTVVDNQGRVIYQSENENVQKDRAVFNVSNLSSGQYFFTIRTEQGYKTMPFTVKH